VCLLFVWVRNLVSHTVIEPLIEGFRVWGAGGGVFGPKRAELGGLRKVHKEVLCDPHCSLNVVRWSEETGTEGRGMWYLWDRIHNRV